MKRHITLVTAIVLTAVGASHAVDLGEASITGNIQSDMLVPQQDDAIGTENTGAFNTNTYLTLNAFSKYISAGLRVEFFDGNAH